MSLFDVALVIRRCSGHPYEMDLRRSKGNENKVMSLSGEILDNRLNWNVSITINVLGKGYNPVVWYIFI